MNVKVILLLLGTALLAAACDSGSDKSEEGSAAVRTKPVAAKSAAGADASIPLGQLPPNVEPLRYRVELTLNPDQLRYEGLVEIDVELKAPKREIYLHGKDLIVSRIVARQSGRPDVRGTYTQVAPDGVARLDFDQQLPSGKITISLPFSAAYETAPDALTSQGEDGIRLRLDAVSGDICAAWPFPASTSRASRPPSTFRSPTLAAMSPSATRYRSRRRAWPKA